MKPLVIYHADCTDGFGAAYAAWTRLGDNAEYLPMHYNTPLKAEIKGRDVYVLDFSFPLNVTADLLAETARLVWLDHHKTAFEMWCGKAERDYYAQSIGDAHFILLDNSKSGALLAWEYFNPGMDVPELFKMIDDRDRWQFVLPNSRAFHAGINMMPFSFAAWDRLTPVGDPEWWTHLSAVIRKGDTVLEVLEKQVRDSASKAEKCCITALTRVAGEYAQFKAQGLAVNTPTNISEVGNELAKASGTFGLVWYFDGKTKRANCSLRSIGEYDVSAIAKHFGGGGHRNAAGFNIDRQTLLEWMK